ncbi:MAG TPA: phosphodiesterase [Candidatus Sulfotelmatobacter sp.]|nr:phosphodiesterase [Candidatus Sulfotelmatobacter sp.]
MLIAQITDTHIKPEGRLAYRVVDTEPCLARCVAAVEAGRPKPDVVLMTGDLVDAGRPEEYARLRRLIAPLSMPVYLIPGNHDKRGALRAAFPDHRYLPVDGEFLHYTVEDWPLRLIGLDTLVPGCGHGALCAERLAWLERQLAAAPERPTVVFMHHPPFATGIAHMDEIALAEPEKFAAIIARHPQVERVLCGHVHRSIQVRFHGTVASVAPSSAHQVALDLRPEGAAAFMLEPPGYQLHLWQPGTGLVTHTAAVGDFAGPYPFFDPQGRLIG